MARMNTDMDAVNFDQLKTYEQTKKQSQVIQIYFSTQHSSAVSDKTAETAEDAESAETINWLVKFFKGLYFIK